MNEIEFGENFIIKGKGQSNKKQCEFARIVIKELINPLTGEKTYYMVLDVLSSRKKFTEKEIKELGYNYLNSEESE